MGRGVRLRTLLLLVGLAAAAVVSGAVLVVVGGTLESRLAGVLPPDQVTSIVRAVRRTVLGTSLLSLLILVPLFHWLGRRLARPFERLRTITGRIAETDAAVPPGGAGIAELDALAGAVSQVVEAYRRRLAPLVREKDELAWLIDSVGEGLLQVDGRGRVVRANRIARDLLGLPEQVVGRPTAVLLRSPELREAIDAAAGGRPVRPFEITHDARRILVIAHTLESGAGGEAPGSVSVLVDTTELRRLEGVRRDFVANVSHELKTPLTSIRGYAETLLADDPPADIRRRFLETVHQNAERLQHIVDDLLDLSRIESGGWQPDFHEVDLAEAAELAWRALQDRADEKGVYFRVAVEREPVLLADPVGIRQIYANLLDNALRYTPGGGTITVRISGQSGHGGANRGVVPPRPPIVGNPFLTRTGLPPAPPAEWVVVEVRDTGSGIPRDALGRVFERFYRVDTARSRAEGGTGLGLAIVKHLVESMGGDVTAESELGKGTTMRFRLPVRVPDPSPASARYPTVTAP